RPAFHKTGIRYTRLLKKSLLNNFHYINLKQRKIQGRIQKKPTRFRKEQNNFFSYTTALSYPKFIRASCLLISKPPTNEFFSNIRHIIMELASKVYFRKLSNSTLRITH